MTRKFPPSAADTRGAETTAAGADCEPEQEEPAGTTTSAKRLSPVPHDETNNKHDGGNKKHLPDWRYQVRHANKWHRVLLLLDFVLLTRTSLLLSTLISFGSRVILK
jgi:hypothetical protein